MQLIPLCSPQHFAMKKFKLLFLFLAISPLLFIACDDDGDGDNATTWRFEVGDYTQTAVQEALILAENGDIIQFGSGTFSFTSTLSLDSKNDITIIGAGMNATILDFSGQISGAEGLKIVNADNLLLQGFTVQDTEGDAIKANDCNGITFYDVAAVWSDIASEDNGAYGLYPVTSENVMIDQCYVKGASDAGIYVGQSRTIIVRNSTVENNVAGIEIENCIGADVYGNTARSNTGGILIFDLPGLTLTNGYQCRVYNNTIEDNDYRNFAPEGNIVGSVPSGTGLMILGSTQVEIFSNTFTNNNVMGIGIVSYTTLAALTGTTINDEDYNPFVSDVYIHDNTMTRTTEYPAEQGDMGNLLQDTYPNGDIPDIVWDGVSDPMGTAPVFCLNNPGGGFVDLKVPFFNPEEDATPYQCTLDGLPEVTVNAPSPR